MAYDETSADDSGGVLVAARASESLLDDVFVTAISALTDARSRVGQRFDDAIAMLVARRGKVVVTGVGKSGLVGVLIAATLNSTGTPAVFMNAGEALHGDVGVVTPDDVVLMLSKSADTPELTALLPSLQRIGATLIGIFGRGDTPLGRAMALCVDTSTVREACGLNAAPTASSTVMLVIGHAIAITLAARKNMSPDHLAVLHPGGHIGRRLLRRVRDAMTNAAILPTIPATASFREAVTVLDRHAFGAVFVLGDGRRLAGIVTDGDVRRMFLAEVGGTTPVAEVMTPEPVVIHPDATLARAIEVMETPSRKIYVLPVVEGDVLVGGVRMHDIVGG